MKKLILSILFAALSILFSARVFANTGPIGWEGTQGAEAYPMKDCPIKVKKERLEFKIKSRYRSYTIQGNIKAVYSLYNPTDETYSLTAAFPVVAAEMDRQDPLFQKVRLNGKKIPYKTWVVTYGKDKEFLNSLTLEDMLKRRNSFTPSDTHFDRNPPILMMEFDVEIPPKKTYKLEITTRSMAFMEREALDSCVYITKQARYTFYYYLSPAKYWADFKDLDIIIKTSSAAPVLMDSNLDFHWAGWRRYRFHSDTLPEGELTFTVEKTFWYAPVRWAVFIALVIGIPILRSKWKKKRYGG